MKNPIEQFAASNQANLQALEALSGQAFAGVEKFVELNMAASKAVLSESFVHAKAILAVKDAQEFMALQAGFMKPMAEKSTAYADHLKSIITGSGEEFTSAVEASSAKAQKAFATAVEEMVKSAPAGSEAAVAAFKSALTAGQNAVETAQASTKKALETAQSNFASAATQATQAVKKATAAV